MWTKDNRPDEVVNTEIAVACLWSEVPKIIDQLALYEEALKKIRDMQLVDVLGPIDTRMRSIAIEALPDKDGTE